MIEITDGFTSISAGADCTAVLEHAYASPSGAACAPRRRTGARVTLEFRRESSLPPGQAVTLRYDFAADGQLREFTGIPNPIRTVVRQGKAVVYYYRLSHWIGACALLDFVDDGRSLTDAHRRRAQTLRGNAAGQSPMLKLVAAGATAIDPPA